jgi:formylglycine-generating enzyme required for sulfatase activity/uncharacterized caspase-like protein
MRFSHIIAVAIAVGWLALACRAAPALADKRVALVVGNAAYRHADTLANPVNDAQSMRDALKKLGFDVIYGQDLDLKALRRAIGQFAGAVNGADVAVVYFAGHGATFGDTPYVVPVDAEFSSLDGVPYELVPVETLIGELRRVKGVRIAILDACRDNGAERGLKQKARGGEVTRGLGPMKNPSGLIITYATQYMSTASDDAVGAGGLHSPFTAALLSNIATPGVDVTDMLRKVGREVDTVTEGRQRPEISISMYEKYALVPGAQPAGGQDASPVVSAAAQAWAAVQNTTSLAVLDDFIGQFGNTPVYGSLARARRDELTKGQVGEPARPAGGGQIAAVAPPAKPAVPADDPCAGPVTVSFPSRCAAPLTAAQERGLKPKDTFRECENCPEMVVVPAGAFTMGSPENEKGRFTDESPRHVVSISKPFAVGKLHVTVDQFAAFVRDTGYKTSSTCRPGDYGEVRAGLSWRNPGFAQGGSHPVVCVNWNDANAYVGWLARKTGKPYRLLSEAEWEYAARGRTSPGAYSRFWFGRDERDLCVHGNGLDRKAFDSIEGMRAKALMLAPCNDGFAHTSPAGHYLPNAFGLYDMAGNAWQWTADCYHGNYSGAPLDGSTWTSGACDGRVVRGGSWNSTPGYFRAAQRRKLTSDERYGVSFRSARTLTP